jgi:hypothetical protein
MGRGVGTDVCKERWGRRTALTFLSQSAKGLHSRALLLALQCSTRVHDAVGSVGPVHSEHAIGVRVPHQRDASHVLRQRLAQRSD